MKFVEASTKSKLRGPVSKRVWQVAHRTARMKGPDWDPGPANKRLKDMNPHTLGSLINAASQKPYAGSRNRLAMHAQLMKFAAQARKKRNPVDKQSLSEPGHYLARAKTMRRHGTDPLVAKALKRGGALTGKHMKNNPAMNVPKPYLP